MAKLEDSNEDFPCGYCDKIFKYGAEMIKHIEDKHQPDENEPIDDENEDESEEFSVSFCTEKADESDSIIETFECFPCQKQFKSEDDLAKHIKDAHDKCSKERKHPCTKCSKSFYTKSDLWSHMRIHSGTKYTCQQCGKQLASSGSLHNHHKSVHQEHKQFECHVCFKTFALKQKLVNHVMTEHEGQKPFQCHKCHQGFVHKQSYEAHQRRHNGQVLSCQHCSRSFHDAGYLKKHLKKHEKNGT